MIVFDLKCTSGHVFEAWFQNSQSFEDQKNAHEIICPACGDTGISKAVMAPNISPGSGSKAGAREQANESAYQESVQSTAVTPAAPAAMMPEPSGNAVREMVETLRSHIRDNCDYVGGNFAEEARKIHYGESEERGIYGEATARETVELRKEGIDVSPLPFPVKYDS